MTREVAQSGRHPDQYESIEYVQRYWLAQRVKRHIASAAASSPPTLTVSVAIWLSRCSRAPLGERTQALTFAIRAAMCVIS